MALGSQSLDMDWDKIDTVWCWVIFSRQGKGGIKDDFRCLDVTTTEIRKEKNLKEEWVKAEKLRIPFWHFKFEFLGDFQKSCHVSIFTRSGIQKRSLQLERKIEYGHWHCRGGEKLSLRSYQLWWLLNLSAWGLDSKTAPSTHTPRSVPPCSVLLSLPACPTFLS